MKNARRSLHILVSVLAGGWERPMEFYTFHVNGIAKVGRGCVSHRLWGKMWLHVFQGLWNFPSYFVPCTWITSQWQLRNFSLLTFVFNIPVLLLRWFVWQVELDKTDLNSRSASEKLYSEGAKIQVCLGQLDANL
jgi:hypothetical protein